MNKHLPGRHGQVQIRLKKALRGLPCFLRQNELRVFPQKTLDQRFPHGRIQAFRHPFQDLPPVNLHRAKPVKLYARLQGFNRLPISSRPFLRPGMHIADPGPKPQSCFRFHGPSKGHRELRDFPGVISFLNHQDPAGPIFRQQIPSLQRRQFPQQRHQFPRGGAILTLKNHHAAFFRQQNRACHGNRLLS